MPLIKVIRKGVTAAVRKVPTSTAAMMMPMRIESVGREATSENQELKRVDDVNDAFKQFKPEYRFHGTAGPDKAEFRAEFKFNSLKDFDPNNLVKKQEIKDAEGNVIGYQRNDIADLKTNIDLLYRLKDRWKSPAVRRAWNNPEQRQEILRALARLKDALTKVSG